jgi:drug/metabolite transporter (DMT)-like permease
LSLANGPKDVPGRFCGAVAGATCCLPCPLQDWVFDDAFMARVRALQRYVSPVSLAACVFLLLSWAVLPPAQSRRHHLSVGLTVFVLFVAVGFFLRGRRRLADRG